MWRGQREEKASKVEHDQTVESLECHDMLKDMVRGKKKDNFSNHTKINFRSIITGHKTSEKMFP